MDFGIARAARPIPHPDRHRARHGLLPVARAGPGATGRRPADIYSLGVCCTSAHRAVPPFPATRRGRGLQARPGGTRTPLRRSCRASLPTSRPSCWRPWPRTPPTATRPRPRDAGGPRAVPVGAAGAGDAGAHGDRRRRCFAGRPRRPALMTTPAGERRSRRRRVWLWILIGLLIAGAVAFLLYLLANSLHRANKTKPVPDVVGTAAPAAQIKLQDAGFKVADPSSWQRQTEEPGTQTGSRGRARGRGGLGDHADASRAASSRSRSPTSSWHDLVGRRPSSSEQNQLILGPADRGGGRSRGAAKHIISQPPNPGEKVAVGSAVNYIISTGPEAVAIPDERGESFVEAFNDLKEPGAAADRRRPGPERARPELPGHQLGVADRPGAGTQVDPRVRR